MAAIERYVRAVYKEDAAELIVGLEYQPDEDLKPLRDKLKGLMKHAYWLWRETPKTDIDAAVAKTLEERLQREWPGRAFFLEVQHDDPDEGWVQVFQPWGLPKTPNEEERARRARRRVETGFPPFDMSKLMEAPPKPDGPYWPTGTFA